MTIRDVLRSKQEPVHTGVSCMLTFMTDKGYQVKKDPQECLLEPPCLFPYLHGRSDVRFPVIFIITLVVTLVVTLVATDLVPYDNC